MLVNFFQIADGYRRHGRPLRHQDVDAAFGSRLRGCLLLRRGGILGESWRAGAEKRAGYQQGPPSISPLEKDVR